MVHWGLSHKNKQTVIEATKYKNRIQYMKSKHNSTLTKLNSVALVRERTIPTERPPPVGEVSANFCG